MGLPAGERGSCRIFGRIRQTGESHTLQTVGLGLSPTTFVGTDLPDGPNECTEKTNVINKAVILRRKATKDPHLKKDPSPPYNSRRMTAFLFIVKTGLPPLLAKWVYARK